MEEIRVYGINIDKFYTEDEERLHSDLSKEEFIEEAEKHGLVWSLEGFEKVFNDDDIEYYNTIIKIFKK